MQQTAEKTKNTYHSTKYYVNAVKNETIRTDHPQQRKSNQWKQEFMDGLIGTILKNEDIPYIVICEQVTSCGVDNYLIDGIQRITTIFNYRIGAFSLGNRVEKPIIRYQVNVIGEDGKPERDDDGNIKHESRICDIRGKGYNDLPDELKEIFDEYQIMEVKHLNCSDDEIGYHLRRYNHAQRMGASQNGVTYLDKKIAMRIKEVTETHTFFKDLGAFKPTERKNDTFSRIILETIMATHFMDAWNPDLKKISTYINEHITCGILNGVEEELDALCGALDKNAASVFTSKDSFLWLTLFHGFYESRRDPKTFVSFINQFKDHMHNEEKNGKTFDEINRTSTKKKAKIIEKLNLMKEFLDEFIREKDIDVMEFIKEEISEDVTDDDLEFYKEMLEDLTVNVDCKSNLLFKENIPSLMAITAYACIHDIDLDKWIVSYFERNKEYADNQKENYIHMKEDLLKFVRSE